MTHFWNGEPAAQPAGDPYAAFAETIDRLPMTAVADMLRAIAREEVRAAQGRPEEEPPAEERRIEPGFRTNIFGD
jgi:hypothetical protein